MVFFYDFNFGLCNSKTNCPSQVFECPKIPGCPEYPVLNCPKLSCPSVHIGGLTCPVINCPVCSIACPAMPNLVCPTILPCDVRYSFLI